jgi:AcrR family transcriptional regulator
MTATGSAPVPLVRHRRRGAALEDAIHTAVFDELMDVGYPAFTIEAAAARAKIGKSSIYRRWQTKQDLVIDAFIARFGGPDDIVEIMNDEQASTRDLLITLGTHICILSGEAGEIMRAVACEVTRDAALFAAVEEKVHKPKQAALLEILHRGVVRGEVRPDAVCEMYSDLLPALLTYRIVLMNRPVSEQIVGEIVDRMIMPLIAPA